MPEAHRAITRAAHEHVAWRRRHVVRGHWRQQAHGPRRSLRRTTWVPPHTKGPAGAPFLPTETVFVWRR